MNWPPGRSLLLAVILSAGAGLCVPLRAQVATNASLPSMPAVKSPVDFFRELLAMPLDERKKSLADRPPEIQKRILAKVREYESLKPDDRELRLRATELRWYLFPLMNMPETNRAVQLAFIPADMRPLVEDRLEQWNKLSPDAQREFLENDQAMQYFTQLESSTGEQRQKILADISPVRRERLEAGIARLRAMPEDQRNKISGRFSQFFDLTPKEKEETLGMLPEAERQQMEKTMRAFEKLTPEKRARCVRAFQKFTGMSLAERQQFLVNAERWRLMSPAERQAWRDLVSKMPIWPPMPPGFPSTLPPLPPLPPKPALSVATNKI